MTLLRMLARRVLAVRAGLALLLPTLKSLERADCFAMIHEAEAGAMRGRGQDRENESGCRRGRKVL